MTRARKTSPARGETSDNIIDLHLWLDRYSAGARPCDTASPEEFLVAWLALLSEDTDLTEAAQALLDRYRTDERSPPTLYELRLHDLLTAIACAREPTRPHRPRHRATPRRRGQVLSLARPDR